MSRQRAKTSTLLASALFSCDDDATVVPPLLAENTRRASARRAVAHGRRRRGTVRAAPDGMADQSLEERVAVLEGYMGGRTLEEHFREHAELIDRRFAEVHARFAQVHARFTAQDKRFEAIESTFHARSSRASRRSTRASPPSMRSLRLFTADSRPWMSVSIASITRSV